MAVNKAEIAWRKILGRMRYNVDGLKNGVDVTTTPEGFKFTYQQFVQKKSESYGIVKASTRENSKNLPDDYISSLIETYPSNVVSAYLDGEFINMATGSVYKFYDRKKCDTNESIKPGEYLYIGQDFNVCNMTSAIAVKRGNELHVVGQLVGIFDTIELVRVLKEKYASHRMFIYPDASGGSRKTVNASTSDIQLLRQNKIDVRVNTKNPMVKDRVLAVNKALETGMLKIKTSVCPDIAEAVEKQAYDKNGEPDKTSGFDHACDALGYLVAYEMPINKPAISTGIRMG